MLANLKREERIGLGIAAGLHAALVLAFLVQPQNREAIEPVERMTVNLASEVGLEATAPEPVAESRAAIAPTLSDVPAPVIEPAPAIAQPRTQPVPQPKLERPAPAKQPTPADTRDRRRPDKQAATPAKPVKKGGGTLVGNDFLAGMGDSTKTTETRAPAAKFGREAQAALQSAITRELRKNWSAPSGADIELLVSVVSWRLNKDGTLAGRPRLVMQRGITDANRSQASVHAERAIRAIQLADFSDLPKEFYSRWDDLEWTFDRRL